MGKKSRLLHRGKNKEAVTSEGAPEEKSFKERMEERADDLLNVTTGKARAKYLPRWRVMSGVDRDEDIDYSIPQIEIEFLLCDPRNLKLIERGKRLDEFLIQLSEPARDVYLNEKDPEGHSYRELEDPRYNRQFARYLGLTLTGKLNKKMIPSTK